MHYKKLIISAIIAFTIIPGDIAVECETPYIETTVATSIQADMEEYFNELEDMIKKQKHRRQTKDEFIAYDIPLDEETQEYIYEICKETDIEFELALGLFKLESNYNHNTINSNKNGTKDIGLGQINNKYIEWYGELANIENFNPYDIKQNIKASLYGLKFYKDYWSKKGYEGDKLIKLALLSYNRGINGAKEYIKKHGYDHAYNRIILTNKEELLALTK